MHVRVHVMCVNTVRSAETAATSGHDTLWRWDGMG